MAVKNILEIWDHDGLIKENVNFLLKPTVEVDFPFIDSVNISLQ